MSTVGRGEKRIPVSSMTAVQWKSATVLGRGFIEFTIPGGNERKSKFGSQVSEARHDENSVTFVKSEQSAFERVREAVETAVATDRAAPPVPSTQVDIADQLRKLGELRDAGVLTGDEFAAKKVELLARQ